MKHLCFSILLLLVGQFATAQISNTKMGSWKDKSIWNTNKVPTSSDDVVLENDVVIDNNSFCRSLHSNGHQALVAAGSNLIVAGNYTGDMLLANWRLLEMKYDTLTEADSWDTINYTPRYIISPYYCTYFAGNNTYYFSRNPCAYDYFGYYLPNCDPAQPPFIIDSFYQQQTNDDLVMDNTGFQKNFYVWNYTKKLIYETSSCTVFNYYPARIDTTGNQGTWSFDASSNFLTLSNTSGYGNYNFQPPADRIWKVVLLTNDDLILNDCLSCNLEYGNRYHYKKL